MLPLPHVTVSNWRMGWSIPNRLDRVLRILSATAWVLLTGWSATTTWQEKAMLDDEIFQA
jgi:hypothetical protein